MEVEPTDFERGTARQLWGGAVQSVIPASFMDVSDIRQVPDHQECFYDDTGGRLLVLEILDYQQQVEDSSAAEYFFQDLAESNGATDCSFASCQSIEQPLVSGLPPNSSLCCGSGVQRVRLGRDFDIAGNRRQQEERVIRVELCAIRLPSHHSDLLVTLSTPCEQNRQINHPSEEFRNILASLQIVDWNLFG